MHPNDKLDDWNTIDALGIGRKMEFLNALWQQAATRAHEQAHVLVHGSRRKYYNGEVSTPMPHGVRNKVLGQYLNLRFVAGKDGEDNHFVKEAGGTWTLLPLPEDLSEVLKQAMFGFIYQMVCCK